MHEHTRKLLGIHLRGRLSFALHHCRCSEVPSAAARTFCVVFKKRQRLSTRMVQHFSHDRYSVTSTRCSLLTACWRSQRKIYSMHRLRQFCMCPDKFAGQEGSRSCFSASTRSRDLPAPLCLNLTKLLQSLSIRASVEISIVDV